MTIHIVRAGETLSAIARQYDIPPSLLAAWNGLGTPALLAVGQALLVLQPVTVYTVAENDTLTAIAAAYGITANELLRRNPQLGGQTDALYPGQTLVIAFDTAPEGALALNGYAYTFISTAVLDTALPYLTYLSVFTYGVSPEGTLVPADDAELLRRAAVYGAAPVLVLSTLDETGTFRERSLTALLDSEAAQQTLLADLAAVMLQKGYRGVDMDFEFVPAAYRDAYTAFIRRAHDYLSPRGLAVWVALAPKTSSTQSGTLYEGHDYRALGAAADRVLLMTYEWGYTYGPPMAVAPIDKVEQVVRYGVSQIPPEKIFMGMPNYAYDWTLPYVRGITRAPTLGNPEAAALAAERGAEILFDDTAQTPYFYYTDNAGRAHAVWFEDVRSIRAKLALAQQYGLYGLGYWNLMRPFSANWLWVDNTAQIIR